MKAGSIADYEQLLRRSKIMEALSLAAEFFLNATPETWEKNVIQVLSKLAEARNAQRVYACKNVRVGQVLKVCLRYEWKQSGEAHVFSEETGTFVAYDEVGLTRWAEVLASGNVICEPVSQLQPGETAWNVSLTAQGLVAVPVFVGEEWWGYIGFESAIEGEEQCSRPEIEALQAVATTFGAAIRNKRMDEALVEEKASVTEKIEERTRQLNIAQAELKAALYHSKEEKARLTASIHSLPMGFVLTNRNGDVQLFNHTLDDILGAAGVPWTTQLIVEKLKGAVDLVATVKAAVTEVQEIRIDEIKVHERWLRLYFTPIKLLEEDNRVIGVVILIEDITEAKELQRARDEFFAVASHELRTPLTAIKGNAMLVTHLMPEVTSNQAVVEALESIETSCSRLTAMVNEYLDVSRLEMSQQVTLTKERFNVVEVVRGAMKGLEEQARSKQLVWELQLPHGFDLWVNGDRARSEQVVINLLGNALKYTLKGGVYVKIEQGTHSMRIAVYDTGEGIDPAEQGSLFQKFKRVGDRVYAREVKDSTGMGLYISRLLAEAMGGKVYLEKSTPGQGSGFVFELPVA